MDRYKVKILERAAENIDEIYAYISGELCAPLAAIKLVDELEEAILSLETMPRKFPIRKTGAFANKGYRQIFVGNFTVVYRICESEKEVLVVAVRYSKSEF